MAFETIHHLNQNRTGKVGEMALKLDMSKAYDRCEIGLLGKNHAQNGFSYKMGKYNDEVC